MFNIIICYPLVITASLLLATACAGPAFAPTVIPVPSADISPVPTLTPLGGGNGKIVYTSGTDDLNIFVMDADGSNARQLTNLPGFNGYAAWSPDGERIAFTTNPQKENFGARILVMNTDGSNQTLVTDFSSGLPHWSPDSKQLVMESDRDVTTAGVSEIYVIDVDGSNPSRLTNAPTFVDAMPRWSSDGKRIAFWSNRDGNPEIYLMNADGSNVTRLTNNPANDDRPIWSPDGMRIAFVSNRDSNFEIYMMNADGSNQTRLTNHTARDVYPVWSPDGTRIMFVSNRDGAFEIYMMNTDGSNVVRITQSGNNILPDWQP